MARFLGIFLKMVWGFLKKNASQRKRGEINDTYRIEFVTDHLKELQRAIEAGAPLLRLSYVDIYRLLELAECV